MASAPPILRRSELPPARAAVDAGALDRRAEGTVCFAVEGSPLGSSSTEDLGAGAVAIRTVVHGRVLSVEPAGLELDVAGSIVRIRCLLPEAVSLEPLAGHVVTATVSLFLHRHRAPTVDMTVLDEEGRLLLWARDGALPSDREAHGVAVRVAQAPGGTSRLVFAAPHALASARAGEAACLVTDVDLLAVALRVAPDDAAFVLVRD